MQETPINSALGAPLEIYRELGLITRMRRMMEQFTADTDKLYDEAKLPFRVSYFYAMYAITTCGRLTIADIAKLAGFSHSAVSQTIKRMAQEKLVETTSTEDGRQKVVCLTPFGETVKEQLLPLWAALERAMKDAMAESGFNLVDSISAIEVCFKKQSLYDRTKAYLAQETTCAPVSIIPYHTRHKQAYYDLNVDWMATTPWSFEEKDRALLSNPELHVLDKGGEIFFAVIDDEAVGTLTMKHTGPGQFELAKLIVTDKARGQGAGTKLCKALVERFQARGGTLLFLETNSTLLPAIELYKHIGFQKLPVPHRSYNRTDYYMEWQQQEETPS